MFSLFLNEPHSKDDDDSLAMRMENQDNDDAAVEPTSVQNTTDNGEPPHFVRANDLPQFLHRPSGNVVKIKCPAAGRLTEWNKFNMQQVTNNNDNNSFKW